MSIYLIVGVFNFIIENLIQLKVNGKVMGKRDIGLTQISGNVIDN